MLNNIFSPWPQFSKQEAKKIHDLLLTNKVNYWTGTECRKFESEFAKYIGSSFAIALSNGTVALDVALRSLGIKKNDEVIVTPRSYIASASCVLGVGAKPVFCDVDIHTGNINLNSIKSVLTKKTKAIICVHLGGYPCEMDKLIHFAKKNKVYVIEDCSQAHGAKFKKKNVGSFGDVATWSFCQDKILTTGGEGGMITTSSKRIYDFIWSYKDQGKTINSVYLKKHAPGYRWLHDNYGLNFRMTEIQAAIGRFQLKLLPRWIKKRNKNAEEILKVCNKFPKLILIQNQSKDIKHAYYKCYVNVNYKLENYKKIRSLIIKKLERKQIPVFTGACPEIYRELIFKKLKLGPKKRLKNAKILGESSLMFLVHPSLKESEIKIICKSLFKVLSEINKKYVNA